MYFVYSLILLRFFTNVDSFINYFIRYNYVINNSFKAKANFLRNRILSSHKFIYEIAKYIIDKPYLKKVKNNYV